MDEQRLTRSYLDTLSTDDLSALAKRLGLDLPEDLNRVFIITELLDASAEEDEEEERDNLREETFAPSSDGLPSGYNETFIGVLLRDPVWAYAFWEIKAADREAHQSSARFEGYGLRVTMLAGPKGPVKGDSFSVAVGAGDDAWYLCLPSGAGWYRIELICSIGAEERTLALSNPLWVPRGALSPSPEGSGADRAEGARSAILALSGIDDLRVLHGGDHESRLPQRCEA